MSVQARVQAPQAPQALQAPQQRLETDRSDYLAAARYVHKYASTGAGCNNKQI